jgi:integrase
MQFLLWLRKSKLNKAGTAPVYLRIFLDADTRSEYATGIRCRPEEWNAPKGRLRSNDEASRAYNKKLKKLLGKAELKADRLQDARDEDPTLPPVMPADVALALRPKPKAAAPPPVLLRQLLADAIPTYSPKASSRHNARNLLIFFNKWPPSATLTLDQLTREVATTYVQWVSQQSCATSTKRHRVGVLAGLLAAAAPGHPTVFAKLTRLLGAALPPKSTVLPPDWQAQFLALRLPRVQALSRDAFMLQYYLHGSRIGVILELQWSHIDYQQGRVRFTTHKHPVAMDMALRPEVREILARYEGHGGAFVLPLLPAYYFSLDEDARFKMLRTKENSIGMALKGICSKLGWPRLKSHLARHTLALRAYLANDKDLRVPQQLLGHKHISTTALYIAGLDTTELDAGAANAYG